MTEGLYTVCMGIFACIYFHPFWKTLKFGNFTNECKIHFTFFFSIIVTPISIQYVVENSKLMEPFTVRGNNFRGGKKTGQK